MKLRMVIELDYDADLMHGDSQQAIDWFREEILMGDGLMLHCNELGDTIGDVRVLSIEGQTSEGGEA